MNGKHHTGQDQYLLTGFLARALFDPGSAVENVLINFNYM